MFQSIGTTEWIVIGLIVLLIFGGKKIPEFFKGIGEAKVDFESKIATVKFDKTKQTIESLTKTIEKVGGGDLYKVTKSEKSTNKA